jgi:hypothetical protein
MPSTARPQTPYRLALAFCAILFLLHCAAAPYVVDDAFITFRYVRNFVEGMGLVYNPGERVEGYTNFLWTILLSGIAWIAPEVDLLSAARFMGVASGLGCIFVQFLFGRRIRGKADALCLAGPFLLAASAPFAAWSTAGLETAMHALLITAASYFYLGPRRTPGRPPLLPPLLFALAAMSRPDGHLFFAIITAHLLIEERRLGWKHAARSLAMWVGVFAAVYVPYYVWRFSYYGYPLPNPFYAKVGTGISQFTRGVKYALEFLGAYGGAALALPVLCLASRLRERWLQVVLAQTVAYCGYVVSVGGDGLGHQRFMVPVLPFLCLLAQEGLRTALSRRPALIAACATTAAVLLARQSLGPVLNPESYRFTIAEDRISFPAVHGEHRYRHFDAYFIERQRLAARWLDNHAPAGSLVAATPAGGIGYYSRLPVLDMLGLNDVHIAHFGSSGPGWNRAGHMKGDGAYVLSRSPDFILLGNVAVLPAPIPESDMPRRLTRTSEHQIWASPTFHRDYERVAVELGSDRLFQYFTFYKKRSVELRDVSATGISMNPPMKILAIQSLRAATI